MKIIISLLLVCSVATAFSEDLQTITGNKFTGVKITRTEPDGISITHDFGIAKIAFRDLPQELQKKYGYDPEKAAAYAAASAKALQDAATLRAEQARQAKIKKGMEALQAAGLVARVKIRQITDDGILGDASLLTTRTVSEVVEYPGTALETVPRKKIVQHEESSMEPLGYIFVLGAGEGLADGEVWDGKLWPAGTYRYTTVQGAAKTIRRYVQTPEEAIALLRESPSNPSE